MSAMKMLTVAVALVVILLAVMPSTVDAAGAVAGASAKTAKVLGKPPKRAKRSFRAQDTDVSVGDNDGADDDNDDDVDVNVGDNDGSASGVAVGLAATAALLMAVV